MREKPLVQKVLCALLAFAGLLGFAAMQAQPACAGTSLIDLTDAETLFIAEHPVIHLGVDPGFIPYEFFDTDGEYKGIVPDYLDCIEEATGLRFEVARELTWPQAYEAAVERNLDALSSVSKTTQREKYFIFSDPYITFQRVIFINEDNKSINDFEDLFGETVAVQLNSSHHSYLEDFDQITLSLYETVEDALRAVADGSETAFVGNLATTSYLAKVNGIPKLTYLSIDTLEPQSLYFVARSDWPELISIVNKALASIDEESRIAISDRWISIEKSADYTWLLRLALIGGGVVALVVLVSSFWIVRLRREIAVRKQSQEELEKARMEADEANQYKSKFLARMSHEIRTPLNGIIGMAYLLKKTKVTMTQRMYVDRITQSSNNMLGIINDILDFSKIEAGKVELEIAEFSMDKAIQDVVSIISYKIEEQKIGLRLTKDLLVPNWFLGDAKRLEQILINILSNAAKFTSEGEVALEIRLDSREKDRCRLTFTVRDTGIGMTGEQAGNLFTPFLQGDTSINRRFGGTGLGLSIVKNLVDLMEGTIDVSSVPGEGSVFAVHLPLLIAKDKENEFKKSMARDLFRDIRTLVLEKNSTGMNLMQNYLDSFGIRSEPTTSPLSALSMLQAANGRHAKPFDLMIVDFDTPVEGGFQFVKSILDNARITQKPKILMMLPMMREDLFDQLDENKVDVGVGKPIIPSVLLNAILDIFQLKVIAASQAAGKFTEEELKQAGETCVLVAEDNQTNQLIAKTLLEQAGSKVLLADNGKTATELFVQNKDLIDLILMDLHMPVMNGYEASAEIRKLSATVPIVAMTADVITGVKEKCEAHGIHQTLTKPFDPEHFLQTIRRILRANGSGSEEGKSVLDIEAGLKNMGMNGGLFNQVLEQYRSENLETGEKLRDAVDERRYGEAAGIVHKLKSSSGSIGAKPLYELAVRLQAVLKEENDQETDALSSEFIEMLAALLDEIQAILATAE